MLKRFSFLIIIALLLAACSGPNSTPLTPSGDGLWLEFPNLDQGYDEIQLVYLEGSNCVEPTQNIPLKRAPGLAYVDFEGVEPPCSPPILVLQSLFRGTVDSIDPPTVHGVFFIEARIAGGSRTTTDAVMRFSDGRTGAVYLAYVDRDVQISGATEDEPYTLNLQAGWNLVRALYTFEGDSNEGVLTAFRSLTPEEINDVELGSKDDFGIG